MNQHQPEFEIGLEIHLLSLSLPKSIIKGKDEISVSITTMPERNKQIISMQKKSIEYMDYTLSVNITNYTKKIIMVFRKKALLSKETIIASTIIHTSDFPKLTQNIDELNFETSKTDVKIMNIYVPFQQKQKRKHEKHSELNKSQGQYEKIQNDRMDRKILGEMQIQLGYTTKIIDNGEDSYKINKKINSKEELSDNDEHKAANKRFRDLMNNRF